MIPNVAMGDVFTSLTSSGANAGGTETADSGAFGSLLATFTGAAPEPDEPATTDPVAADSAEGKSPVESSVLLQLLAVLGLMPAAVPVVAAPTRPEGSAVDATSTVVDITDVPTAPAAPAPAVAGVTSAPLVVNVSDISGGTSAVPDTATAGAASTAPAALGSGPGSSSASPVPARPASLHGRHGARPGAPAAVETTDEAVGVDLADAVGNVPADGAGAPAPVRKDKRRDELARGDRATTVPHPHSHSMAAAPTVPEPIVQPAAVSTKLDKTGSTGTATSDAAASTAALAASAVGPGTPPAVTDAAGATTAASAGQASQQPWEQVASMMKPLRKFSDGSHRLAVQLHPDDLGTVHVELSLHKGQLNVHMVANNPAARDALLNSLGDLRADLEASGVRAASINVGADTMRSDGIGVKAETTAGTSTPSTGGSLSDLGRHNDLSDAAWQQHQQQQSNRRRGFTSNPIDDLVASAVDGTDLATASAVSGSSNLDLRI